MTADPTAPPVPEIVSRLEDKINEQSAAVLEDLFLLGHTTSKKYTIYKDDQYEIVVQFRSLLPYEIREIQEQVIRFNSPIGRAITEQIETLARAIKTINDAPLILVSNEREEYFRKNKRYASPLEMAKIILIEKLKSEHLLDAMFESYTEFANGLFEQFDEIKKKLKTQKSSS
jgi:hypothetical protein